VALVRITVPPDQVDVNVHPTKAEVRFRHERLVYSVVQAAVRNALDGAGVPLAPRPTFGAPPRREEPTTPFVWSEPASLGRDVVAGAQVASLVAPAPPSGAAAGGEIEDEADADAVHERLPALRPLGQVELTYIVAEAPDGMYLVDQHAAHERVLYEQALARRREGAVASQPLLAAVVAPLSASQALLAHAEAELLATIGWEFEATDGAAVLLRSVPADLRGRDPARALAEYLDRLDAEERLTGPDRVAATLACRAAVMAGDRLEGEQQRALLRALEACETPHTCPHGRPTMLHLSRAALDRSFGRR
jgi:DNA mismatch repair protein MutL